MRSLVVLAFSVGLAAQGPPPPPQPLPPQPVPPQNPITPQKAILGKLLFWEEQMSSNNRVACGTCHTFAAGGGDTRRQLNPGVDGVAPSPDDVFASPGIIRSDAGNRYLPDQDFGFRAQVGRRTSPSFLTAAWFPDLFWDGRASGTFTDPTTNAVVIPAGGALESQSLGPILSSDEMAHDARTFAEAIGKLQTVRPMAVATNLPADMQAAIANGATYPDLFAAAFGTPDITAQRIAFALATYQRTLRPDQTPYDQFLAGNQAAMTQQQINGMNVFHGPGRCVICHTSGLFSDRQYHNLGLRPIAEDAGRQEVTSNPGDAGRFKTPSLRNVGLRGSLMHNGQFTNVTQVVGFYIGGGGPFLQNKDPQLIPLNGPPPGGVPPQAAADLAAFVSTALTDPRVAAGLPPFDRPTLRGQLLNQQGSQYGLGSAGAGGQTPQWLAEVPANIGNVDFKLGVFNGLGGAPATLVLGLFPTATQINGVNINVAFGTGELLVPGVLQGAVGVPGAGYGTLKVGVPNEPGLAGIALFGQWFVWDGSLPAGVASTRGAQVLMF
ncbi:MAG: hypothetical protein H6835_02565 [Planctomycetes bacterium]|nr:hypothetical protein [Planctomycetota bacterium]